MLGIGYNHALIRLGFSFFTLLVTHHIGFAKGKKDKKVAIVDSKVQKKNTDAAANSASKTRLQNELEIENALNRARLEKELSTIIAEINRLRVQKEHLRLSKEVEDEAARKEHDKAICLLSMEKEKLILELELAKARLMQQMEAYDGQLVKLDKKIELEQGQAQLLKQTVYRLQVEMEALQAQAARGQHIQKKPIYLKDPLIKGSNTLILSDRCIDLNGLITPWKANYIVDQIHYFNNKNNHWPIFLIIGCSPGGYVLPGWNILQAIEHSKAPVYVVVKSFAASMAALIVTLATKSYAYPNAVILHHQPMIYFYHGNVREAKEAYANLNEIWRRLGGRVAKKMGISLTVFEKKLYEKAVYGDWQEYGNNAKKLKWVDYVISSIQHSAISSLPNAADYTFEKFIKQHDSFDAVKRAEEERYYHALAPHDFNYSYRPDSKAQMMDKK